MRFDWIHLPTVVVAGGVFVGFAFWQNHRLSGAVNREPGDPASVVRREQSKPSEPLEEVIREVLSLIPPDRPGSFDNGKRSRLFMKSWVSSQSDERLSELAEMETSEDTNLNSIVGLARTNLSLRHPAKAIEIGISLVRTANDYQALEAWAARDSEAALQWLEDHEAAFDRPKLAYRSAWAGLARNDLRAALVLAEGRDDLPRAMSVIARSIQSEAQAAMALRQFSTQAMKLHAEEASRSRSGPRDLHVTEILRSIVMRPLLTAEESIRLIDSAVPEMCRDRVATDFFSHQFPHSAPVLLNWLDERSRLGGDTDWIRRAFGSIDREHLDTAVSFVQSRRDAPWYSDAMSSLNRRLERARR